MHRMSGQLETAVESISAGENPARLGSRLTDDGEACGAARTTPRTSRGRAPQAAHLFPT